MTSLRLSDIERQSWRKMNRDGLMDILFGFMLLGASISALVSQMGQPDWLRMLSLVVVQFGGVGFLIWMRRQEVAPRLGRVKFATRRTRQTRRLRILLACCVAITVLLVVLTAMSNRLGFSWTLETSKLGVWLVISAIILVPIGAIAAFLNYPRLVLYGGWFSMVEFCLIVLGLENGTPYAAPILYGAGSLLGFAIGIPVFVRFLRSIPRFPSMENGGSAHGTSCTS